MSSLRSGTVLAAAWVLVGVLGCGGTESETIPAPDPYASQADFCAALAAGECSNVTVKACYGSDDASLKADKASCEAKRRANAACESSVTGLADPPALTYDSKTAEACIAKHTSIYADGQLTHDEIVEAREVCIGVFHGSSGANAACTVDAECDTSQGLRCVVKGDKGICVVPTKVGPGMDCTDPSSLCEAGFYCDDGGHCVSGVPADKSCSASKPCGPDLNCVITDTETGEGKCEPKLANGQTCSPANPEVCAGGFCNSAEGDDTGKCVSTLQLSNLSAACSAF